MTTNQHAFDHYPDESQLHDDFDRDLHPARYKAQRDDGGNVAMPTLYDQKAATRELPGLTDDELRRIPVLREGTRLEQGSSYLDLADPNAKPFKALGGTAAGPDSIIIAKDEVDYLLWNRLIGVAEPARLDESSDNPGAPIG